MSEIFVPSWYYGKTTKKMNLKIHKSLIISQLAVMGIDNQPVMYRENKYMIKVQESSDIVRTFPINKNFINNKTLWCTGQPTKQL